MTTGDQEAFAAISQRIERLRSELVVNRSAYERIIVHLSELSAVATDSALRRAIELLATVVATDHELKVLLLQEFAQPENREVWEKYLALLSWVVIEELPSRIGQEHAAAGKTFKAALQPIKDDVDFVKNLRDIRNRVVAHRDLAGGDHWLAQWHLTAIANKHNAQTVVRSKIVVNTEILLGALNALGQSLLNQHPEMLPSAGPSAN